MTKAQVSAGRLGHVRTALTHACTPGLHGALHSVRAHRPHTHASTDTHAAGRDPCSKALSKTFRSLTQLRFAHPCTLAWALAGGKDRQTDMAHPVGETTRRQSTLMQAAHWQAPQVSATHLRFAPAPPSRADACPPPGCAFVGAGSPPLPNRGCSWPGPSSPSTSSPSTSSL